MGLLSKSKIEEIKKAQRDAKIAKKRKVAVRPVSVSFLIVCEGTRTEPNYFKSLIKDRYSAICEVDIEGEGRGTVTGVSRVQYIDMIEREIQAKTGNSNYRYQKKSDETFGLLQRAGDEALAIRHAQRLKGAFVGTDYASHKPCTTVDELVEELSHPEKLL